MTAYRRALVLGGARSGKSRTAQSIAESASVDRLYIATAQAFDDEMRERIAHHQSVRGGEWQTREAPLALADAIRAETAPSRVVLVDCLTLWLSNILLAEQDVGKETDLLIDAIRDAAGPLVLVSNEVGQGIVPATPLGRSFRDEQGRVNQRLAEVCETVVFVAAGCPLLLKPAAPLHVPLA
ncbi:bifunctional adenosylcobinamide kinase/adenosylcobinamide-phosphate guanylyltransferase [Microvirga terricola]|uniref:Bifunctional adenosylcobalamin biosynthesis protein n=1 Tax=Microvirga terricola TaxID=2719797 RepID=A0ABX0VDX8_9HYPH|nr:bifunctional adenosylcobinamide kinase/adenosylcobinamide-phosphate guanylyltransferase [Microvirga terricola]NIX77863.1 bifunctional adenosylcobinamide kinase/adenosylcobinamide-phosphate guanylyltransferase [Microvirga terricola]